MPTPRWYLFFISEMRLIHDTSSRPFFFYYNDSVHKCMCDNRAVVPSMLHVVPDMPRFRDFPGQPSYRKSRGDISISSLVCQTKPTATTYHLGNMVLSMISRFRMKRHTVVRRASTKRRDTSRYIFAFWPFYKYFFYSHRKKITVT